MMNTRTVGALAQGTVLYQGRYRIDLLLTRTPLRAIYRAWDLTHNRAATLVELAPVDDAAATTALERAAPLVQLDHASLLSFQVVFVEHETVFIALTFAGGQTIAHIMAERATPIPPAAAVRWISQTAEMLEYFATALPDWHLGDLSSSALFVTVEDRAQPIGFEIPLGLLTPAQVAADLPAGAVAPELAQGQCDARADVFALAATLHLLLTGQPWPGGDPAQQTALDALHPALPAPVIAAERRALAVAPADRWSDVAAFHGALLAGMAEPAPPPAAADEWWLGAASQPLPEEPATLTTPRDDLAAALAAEADAQGSAPRWPVPSEADQAPAPAAPDVAASSTPGVSSDQTIEPVPPNQALPEATALAATETTTAPAVEPANESAAVASTSSAPTESQPPAPAPDVPPAPTAEPAHTGLPAFVLPLAAAASGAAIIAAVEGVRARRPSQPLATPTPSMPIAPAPAPSVPPIPPMAEESPVVAATAPAAPPPPADVFAPPADHVAVPDAVPDAAVPPTEQDLPQRGDLGSAPDGGIVTNALWGALTPDLLDNLAHMPPPLPMRGIEDVQPVLATAPAQGAASASAPAEAASSAETAPPVGETHAPHSGIGDIVLPVATAGAALLAAGAITHAFTSHDHDTPAESTPTDAAPPPPAETPTEAAFPAPATPDADVEPATPAATDVPPVAGDQPEPWLPAYSAGEDWLTQEPPAQSGFNVDGFVRSTPDGVSSPAPTSDTVTTPYGRRGAWWDEPVETDTPSAPAGTSDATTSAPMTQPTPPSLPAISNEPAETAWATHANGQANHDERAAFASDAAIMAALSGIHSVPAAETPPAPLPEQFITAHPDWPTPPSAEPTVPSVNLRPTHAPNTTPLASKTPSIPLVDRIRSILQTPALPAAATGTVVVPRHMYPQHSYSILVRLQYRSLRKAGDSPPTSRPLAIVEVEAPEDAFYLPVHKLALPIPLEGGLSEGTLAITAQRPTPNGTDRLTFTFRLSDGTILHKGQFIADVTILSPQQMASGNPMLTLVHTLDIPF